MQVSERGRENSQESKQTCLSPCLFPDDARFGTPTIGFQNYCMGCMDLRRVLDEIGSLASAPRVVRSLPTGMKVLEWPERGKVQHCPRGMKAVSEDNCLRVERGALHTSCFQPVEYNSRRNGQLSDIQQVIAIVLDISTGWTRIELSPPIHFRIEWARGQGNVTALWQRAHFNWLRPNKPPIDAGRTTIQ